MRGTWIVVVVSALIFIFCVLSTSNSRFVNNVRREQRTVHVCDFANKKNTVALTRSNYVSQPTSRYIEDLRESLRNESHLPIKAWGIKSSVKEFVDTLAYASKEVSGAYLDLHRIGVFVSKGNLQYQELIHFSSFHGHYLHPFVHGASWGPYITRSTPRFLFQDEEEKCQLKDTFREELQEISRTLLLNDDDDNSISLIASHGVGHAASILTLQGSPPYGVSVSQAVQCMYSICEAVYRTKESKLFGCMHGAYVHIRSHTHVQTRTIQQQQTLLRYMVLKIQGWYVEAFLKPNQGELSLAHEILKDKTRVDREFWQHNDCCTKSPLKAACEMWRPTDNQTCCLDFACAFGHAQPCTSISATTSIMLSSVAGTAFEASLVLLQRYDNINTARLEILRMCETPFSDELVHTGLRRFGISSPANNVTRKKLHSLARGACLSASSLVFGGLYYIDLPYADGNSGLLVESKNSNMKHISFKCLFSVLRD